MTARCSYVIEGPDGTPNTGRRHPMWRRRCNRWTRDESGLCWQHNPESWAKAPRNPSSGSEPTP